MDFTATPWAFCFRYQLRLLCHDTINWNFAYVQFISRGQSSMYYELSAHYVFIFNPFLGNYQMLVLHFNYLEFSTRGQNTHSLRTRSGTTQRLLCVSVDRRRLDPPWWQRVESEAARDWQDFGQQTHATPSLKSWRGSFRVFLILVTGWHKSWREFQRGKSTVNGRSRDKSATSEHMGYSFRYTLYSSISNNRQ